MSLAAALTVGWAPFLATSLADASGASAGVKFVHALVDESDSIGELRQVFPQSKFVALAPGVRESLPYPDVALLASLEGDGVPSFRTMIFGDPHLRHLPLDYGLAYATLIVRNLVRVIVDEAPDFVMASDDRLHSGAALATARALGVPFVAPAFTVLPTGRTGFVRALFPDALVPLKDPDTQTVMALAKRTLADFQARGVSIPAYKAPFAIRDNLRRSAQSGRRYVSRVADAGLQRRGTFKYVSFGTGVREVARRGVNRVSLPSSLMIRNPPDQKYVLHVLQMSPESTVDTWAPWYRNQINLVKQVAIAVPADHRLVVKPHFGDPDNFSRRGYKDLMSMGIEIAHPLAPTRDLIEQASLVSAISSTAALEGALLGKPVVLFADSPYKRFPLSKVSMGPQHLRGEIEQLLGAPPPSEESILGSFARYLGRYLPGLSNEDWSVPVTPDECERFAMILARLVGYISDIGASSWYEQPPFGVESQG